MNEVKLAIAGEMRSGKSTLSEYAEETYHAVPFAFGDELKKGFHYQYPHVPRHPKPRKGYQLYGQLMRYVHGEDYWLNQCFDQIKYIRSVARNYNTDGSGVGFIPLITDARQPNEFERCREEGYTIIKVVAPLAYRVERSRAAGDNFELEDLQHETESWIKDLKADFTINNDGSKTNLYLQFDGIMEQILKSQG